MLSAQCFCNPRGKLALFARFTNYYLFAINKLNENNFNCLKQLMLKWFLRSETKKPTANNYYRLTANPPFALLRCYRSPGCYDSGLQLSRVTESSVFCHPLDNTSGLGYLRNNFWYYTFNHVIKT